MHNANTTALTVACAVIVAVLSLVLSLGRMLKAVVIISDLQSLGRARHNKRKREERRETEVKLRLEDIHGRTEDWTVGVCFLPQLKDIRIRSGRG